MFERMRQTALREFKGREKSSIKVGFKKDYLRKQSIY
jgi:hypothetical protein